MAEVLDSSVYRGFGLWMPARACVIIGCAPAGVAAGERVDGSWTECEGGVGLLDDGDEDEMGGVELWTLGAAGLGGGGEELSVE